MMNLEILNKQLQEYTQYDYKHREYQFKIDKLTFTVCNDTLSYYFNGWNFFSTKLKELVNKNEDFLEIGAGVGINSLLLANDGVNVTVVDINNKNLQNILLNAKKNNIQLKKIFLSNIYDGFHSKKKFDSIYWNSSFIKKIDNCDFGYGFIDNNYKNIEKWIKESRNHLKTNGKLYIGHSSLGDFKKLEFLLDKYDYKYKVLVKEYSKDIRNIDFFMYEAKPKEKANNIIIVMPFTGKSYEQIIEEREEYTKKVNSYNLFLLESFIGVEEKEKFEQALYEPDFIINKDINLINQANVMLVDLSKASVGATFEVSYAKLKREIPIIGFGCTNELTKRHPWYNYYCDDIVDTIDDALNKAFKILK